MVMRLAGDQRSGAVRTWLYIVAALVIAMVAVGGATRLTGSGLSITEWRPVTGAIPPLSEADWAAEFAKYKDTPQYNILNRVNLPNIPISNSQLGTGAVITAIAVLLFTLLAAFLGGKAGHTYHDRVDRAAGL